MLALIKTVEFWIAMLVAAVLKARASPPQSRKGAVSSIFAGVGAAAIFTGPIAAYIGVADPEFSYAVAALVFLTAEHVARAILSLTLADIIKIYRGK